MLDIIAYVTKTMFRFFVLSDYLILLFAEFCSFPQWRCVNSKLRDDFSRSHHSSRFSPCSFFLLYCCYDNDRESYLCCGLLLVISNLTLFAKSQIMIDDNFSPCRGVEHIYRKHFGKDGVTTKVGYTGGNTEDPDYRKASRFSS